MCGSEFPALRLQGCIGKSPVTEKPAITLCDPAIQSLEYLTAVRTNLGQPGINLFFRHHTCNALCSALGLPPAPAAPQVPGKAA